MDYDNIRQLSYTVGASVTQVAALLVDGQRTALTLINTSTGGQVITIKWGSQDTITGAGIVLYPAGSWSESYDGGFIPSNLDIYAIASAAGGTLSVHERVRTSGIKVVR